jgi:threonine dehydrogenase-like Zn-dependent dehydrogenase
VPNADLVLVKAPKKGVSPEKLLALADVTTTAWHGCELAEVGKDDVVGVWGCGPVGSSIAKLSLFRGAKKVYVIDPDPERLKIAESFGCIPVDVNKYESVAEHLLQSELYGLDKGIEASGFRSARSWLHSTMRALGRHPTLHLDRILTVAQAQKAISPTRLPRSLKRHGQVAILR